MSDSLMELLNYVDNFFSSALGNYYDFCIIRIWYLFKLQLGGKMSAEKKYLNEIISKISNGIKACTKLCVIFGFVLSINQFREHQFTKLLSARACVRVCSSVCYKYHSNYADTTIKKNPWHIFIHQIDYYGLMKNNKPKNKRNYVCEYFARERAYLTLDLLWNGGLILFFE